MRNIIDVMGLIETHGEIEGRISGTAEIDAELNNGVAVVVQNDYNALKNLPKINKVELKGNLTSESLGIGELIFKDNYYLFPNVGNSRNLYIDVAESVIYRWDDVDLKYYVVANNSLEIDGIYGGNASGTKNN